MEIVGRNIASSRWSRECALSCYRASKTTEKLSDEEYQILDELYSRLTRDKDEKETRCIMDFWNRLDDYRSGLLQGGGPVAQFNGEQMIENFKYDVLWYDLSRYEQQQIKITEACSQKCFSTNQDGNMQL